MCTSCNVLTMVQLWHQHRIQQQNQGPGCHPLLGDQHHEDWCLGRRQPVPLFLLPGQSVPWSWHSHQNRSVQTDSRGREEEERFWREDPARRRRRSCHTGKYRTSESTASSIRSLHGHCPSVWEVSWFRGQIQKCGSLLGDRFLNEELLWPR